MQEILLFLNPFDLFYKHRANIGIDDWKKCF